ncbi:50S ribosomal protein L21 [Chelatococcus reniformis]|jgi:large subunit ribosomal protein L21|uniref:Large ribosomal subunit protein bL21 n=1 Tax=Chelatococcus reniformis TaxID=1494448 RepID=A0A916TWD6_9HYPH|nr:50S ribosomal protein L21 [Chelatococcus reniformis]GGC46459.1 50S ribosomal protein L21 [Chelatococcus reniformis]
MFAVIKTGGKQYRVAANDTITVAKLAGEAGDAVSFDVLLLAGDENVAVGAQAVASASVAAEIVRHGRGEKVIAFKKRRRQNSKRKRGHRQDHTVVRITGISA